MFGIFKRKPQREDLEKQYRKLTDEAVELSFVNLKRSGRKMAKAEKIMKQIANLECSLQS